MSDLSERLVDVANEAMFENLPKPQRAIVAAVLRELAADRFVYGHQTLTDLADEIEEKQQ